MFSIDQKSNATALLAELRQKHMTLATAESCTGGLIIGLLTEIAGASDVVDRGFITYSNAAKTDMLGIPADLITQYGAVSSQVAIAMALGALSYSKATISIAVTGIAGPGGGSTEKPVGLVHLGVAKLGNEPLHQECRFGDLGREIIRSKTITQALLLLRRALT